jgi:hypothetical protein
LNIAKKETEMTTSFEMDWFLKPKGVAVVDFYIAKNKRTELIDFLETTYDSIMNAAGVKDISYWINQTNPEVDSASCHDEDLLVTITFYRNEPEYNSIIKKLNASMEQETKFKMLGIVTTKNTWILRPTNKSYSTAKR